MRLARVPEPFEHPDWIFEIKSDGWRGVACCHGAATRLVSRRGKILRSFKAVAADISAALDGRENAESAKWLLRKQVE